MFAYGIMLDFDRFASCSSVECVSKERNYLEECSEMGDPNAMYAMSLLYCFFFLLNASLRFGMYNYTRDEALSEAYLQFASDAGSAFASLALGIISSPFSHSDTLSNRLPSRGQPDQSLRDCSSRLASPVSPKRISLQRSLRQLLR